MRTDPEGSRSAWPALSPEGAFEAGVLHVVAEREIPVHRIMAVSSGALNGTVYAAGIRARREQAAAKELIALWEERGGARDVINLSVTNMLRRVGLSDQDKLLALLRQNVLPRRTPNPASIDLHILEATRLQIIPIRPLTPLPGNAFSGFFSSGVRRRYIEVGIERANQVLDQIGWR